MSSACILRTALAMILACVPLLAAENKWKPFKVPLMTTWGEQIDPAKVWQEYPRPQMVRKKWQNLNGLWEYAVVAKDAVKPTAFTGNILVPFPLESALSGVGHLLEPKEALWYRRTVTIAGAGAKAGQRVLLHFEGVDWDATVWVNGKEVGNNQGMHTWWNCDITEALAGGTQAEIVLKVLDPTEAGNQPLGKQKFKPNGCFYTRASGIWQTVWAEVVPTQHITALIAEQVASLDGVEVTVQATGGDKQTVTVTMSDKGIAVAKASGKAGERLKLTVANPKLWSPDSPHLYDLSATLDGGDTVTGYTAVRWCDKRKDAQGINRLFLNGKELFHFGPLDQGWWPDGLITPPSDEAMVYDLKYLKSIGCNMLRKHIKVEPARYYYACDKLGLLVWQDFPSGESNRNEAARINFKRESATIIEQLRGFPCIVMWVVFNEGWGQFDTKGTQAITAWTKETDPRRLVCNASGWTDQKCGDIIDAHAYPGPRMPAIEADRIAVLGEFGGLGLQVKDHLWQPDSWGYQSFGNAADLEKRYLQLVVAMRPLIARGLAAAVYTQTTDVEGEVNGWLTYDRKIIKIPTAALAAMNARLYLPTVPPIILAATADDQRIKPALWRWTTTKPTDGWEKPGFNDTAWAEGPAGFGTAGTSGAIIGTEWKTDDIWLRRSFTYDGKAIKNPALYLCHDDAAEIFINGQLVASAGGSIGSYITLPIQNEKFSLTKGANILSVHCHQDKGGQYIDVGLIDNPE